jgi:hypothetical protein
LFIQPLSPKEPLRVLELILVNCKLDILFALIIVDESVLLIIALFLKLPLCLILNIALDAVERLVNLPAASNLIPKTDLCLIKFIVLACI